MESHITSRQSLIGVALLLIVLSLGSKAALAGYESDDSRDEKNEYNFSWLDPEKKIYVLQNRKYQKAGHAMLSVMSGAGFSNPYRNNYIIDSRATYFATEMWGLEFFYTMGINSDSNTLTTLTQASNGAVIPTVRDIRGMYGARLQFAPWYAKINVFNSILYFDWFFGLGLASIQSSVNATGSSAVNVPQDLVGLNFGTGHIFHLGQNFLLRWELTGTVFSAQTLGTTGVSTLYSNYTIGLGAGWKF